MTPTEQLRGQDPGGDETPCRGETGAGTPSLVFSRVGARLAELVQISTGRAADRTFDALLCPVPAGDVAAWRPPIQPGRWAAFTFYGPRAFEPLLSLYLARVRSFARLSNAALSQAGALPWKAVDGAERVRGFLTEIGLPDIRVYAEQLGYHLHSATEWWDVLSKSSLGAQARHLPVEQRERLKRTHLGEVAALTEGAPIWVEVPVIFAIGRRPQG